MEPVTYIEPSVPIDNDTFALEPISTEPNFMLPISSASFPAPVAASAEFPERMNKACEAIDWSKSHTWNFSPIDNKKYPAVELAKNCGRSGGGLPAIYNAANEVAVAAFESGEDLHSTVASLVFGVKANEVDAEMRRTIKAMSYGLAYGLSSFGLAQTLDIDPASASELMAKYFERFGGIRDYLKTVVVTAREKGYTETILGRRRYLPELNHENRQRREIAERAALNAPIQGSAADIIKIAMLHVQESIVEANLKSRLLLQVHDELILEVWPDEKELLEKIVRDRMSKAYKLNVPLDVNIGFGKSWDLAAH